jgi:hypothetical protein
VTRKLVIISGPDRVGKSTVCSELIEQLGEENCEIIHLAEPPLDQEDPYDVNRDKIQEWVASGKEWCFFDRSYPCSMVFEERRRGNAGHLSHIVELEIELLRCEEFKVIHVVYDRPWHWSAKHHLAEIDSLYPRASDWAKRDHYISRMKEHQLYYERISDFTTNVTAFPTYWHKATPHPDDCANRIINLVSQIANK